MALFRHKVSGDIVSRPAHYANHPVLGKNLILITEEAKAPEEKKEKKAPAKKATDYIPFVSKKIEEDSAVGVEIPQEPKEAPEENIDNNEENN